VLRRDAALAAHLLRVANSALYRGPSAIVSLQQAVSRLGMERVRDVALAIACGTRVFAVRGFAKEVRAELRHALGTAEFAQRLARGLRLNVEEAFLAGLLHDVGRVVLLDLAVALDRRLQTRAPREALLGLTGAGHERVGGLLATRWELSPRVVAAITSHHEPDGTPLAAVVHLADRLAHGALGTGEATVLVLPGTPAALSLNLYPEDLEALAGGSAEVCAAVEALG